MPLEKVSSIKFNFSAGFIEKIHEANVLAESERVTLKTLHDLRRSGKTDFLSPDPQMELCGRNSTVMTYLPGMPVLDLVLAGARIAQTSDSAFRGSFLKWREQIAEDALKDMEVFQSGVVQDALAQELGNITKPYNYAGKLQEAVKYVCTVLDRRFDDALEGEIGALDKLIQSHPQVHFLDPILTNRIFCPENFPDLSRRFN